jgi:hypothetical protein
VEMGIAAHRALAPGAALIFIQLMGPVWQVS